MMTYWEQLEANVTELGYSLKRFCEIAGIPRSTYYRLKKVKQPQTKNEILIERTIEKLRAS